MSVLSLPLHVHASYSIGGHCQLPVPQGASPAEAPGLESPPPSEVCAAPCRANAPCVVIADKGGALSTEGGDAVEAGRRPRGGFLTRPSWPGHAYGFRSLTKATPRPAGLSQARRRGASQRGAGTRAGPGRLRLLDVHCTVVPGAASMLKAGPLDRQPQAYMESCE